ncbi:MAG: AAA family ATPase, partial [Janthinobacterium lividum]
MARVLLVVPTGHGAGLTSTCLGLLRALDARGVAVGFHKPLAQATRDGGPDRSVALVRLTTSLDPAEPIPATRVVERLSRGEVDDLMEEVVAAAEKVLAHYDVVIVEGLAPSADQVFSGRVNQALATALDADVLLVGSAGPDVTDFDSSTTQSTHGTGTHGTGTHGTGTHGTGTHGTGPHGIDLLAPERIAEDMAVTAGTYRAGEALRVVGGVVSRWPVSGDPDVA